MTDGGIMHGRMVQLEYDPVTQGGWFCYGRCRAFTVLDMDREQNVCARCGRPTVRLLPPVRPQPQMKLAGKPVSQERAAELFAAMKETLADETTEAQRHCDD